MWLTKEKVAHPPITSKATAIAALQLLTPRQAEVCYGWLGETAAEKAAA